MEVNKEAKARMRCGVCGLRIYPRDDGPDKCACGPKTGLMFKPWEDARTECPDDCLMVASEREA